MKYFGFMDETGVLSNDPNQRFFALGLLKLENTSILFENIKQLKDRSGKQKNYEFKFTDIKRNGHLSIHEKLIDICLAHSKFYFSCIIIDKISSPHSVPTTTWDAQIELAKKHVNRNVKSYESIAIIADYLSKPNASQKYFEDELNSLQKVHNSCMLESHASAFIQAVDILIGCVVYRYKIEKGLAKENTPKGKLVKYLEEKLSDAYTNYNNASGNFKHQQNLIGGFTLFEPFYFSVFEKR